MDKEVTLTGLRASALRIPFRAAFTHAAASRAETAAVWVQITAAGGIAGYGEGCPRQYVTGESVAGALRFIGDIGSRVLRDVSSIDTLREWVRRNQDRLDAHPAAWCAIELAILDVLARRRREPVESVLGLPPIERSFRYTAVLDDSEYGRFMDQLSQYLEAGFRDFKLKISGNRTRDRARARALQRLEPGARIRFDANNLWRKADCAVKYIRDLGSRPTAVEEPLAPGDYAGCARLADGLQVPVILDEGLLRAEQLEELPAPADRWIANLRVSKLGGLLRSLDVLTTARERGIRVIVGAQVGETSVLTRAAMALAGGAGELLAGQEGAFGELLLREDTCDPPLSFGAGGILAPVWLAQAPGLGLSIRRSYAWPPGDVRPGDRAEVDRSGATGEVLVEDEATLGERLW